MKCLALGAAAALAVTGALASSHREAPAITATPKVDATDFYIFNSYESGRAGYVTMVANYLPLQDPYGGPNYFTLDPSAKYEIKIDNNGDAVEDLGDHAWYTGNAKGNDPPVGAKKPNPWKLYDIHGYLWEWCADPWHPSYESAPADGSTWTAGGDPDSGVLRGGSWKDRPEALRSHFRRAAPRSLRDDAVGLRCVLARGG